MRSITWMPNVDGMYDQHERDRRCSALGCTTKLSRYNTSNDLCFAHADERSRARFEKRPAPATASVVYRHRSTNDSIP